MEISQQDAKEIVDELSDLIGMNVNITDEDAVIIANSDPRRVGHFHEASRRVLDEHLDELVVMDTSRYKGACSGTNLPLELDGKVVGTVGIAGPYQQAVAYGKVTKRMAESLLKEKRYERERDSRALDRARFAFEWVCDPRTELSDEFKLRGKSLGLDITRRRRVLVISARDSLGIPSDAVEQELATGLLLSDPSAVGFLTQNGMVVLLSDIPDPEMREIVGRMVLRYEGSGLSVAVGVGGSGEDYRDIRQQYGQALKALEAARQCGRPVVLHADLGLDLLLGEVPLQTRRLFLSGLFAGFSPDQRARALKTLRILYGEGGSVEAAAAILGERPEALGTYLQDLRRVTGHDPLDLGQAAVFGCAMLCADIGA